MFSNNRAGYGDALRLGYIPFNLTRLASNALETKVAWYFLHLHHSGTIVLDEEGVDLETDEQAQLVASLTARELIGADALNGVLALNSRIDIADSSGCVVGSVRFKDAVTVIA